MTEQMINGHKITADEKTNITVMPCPKCGHYPDDNGNDYCLGQLPGVIHACCGHGVDEGYIMFENGVTIRGWFEVEK